MIIDIRKDLPDFHAYLGSRLAPRIAKAHRAPPVTAIQFGFEFGQANWIALVFDTRPDPKSDGHWTLDIDKMQKNKALLLRQNWPLWDKLPPNESVTFIDLDGNKVDITENPDDLACRVIGDALRHVLIAARAEGLFVPLPKAPRCEMAVENIEGYYAWPLYEERGRENLA